MKSRVNFPWQSHDTNKQIKKINDKSKNTSMSMHKTKHFLKSKILSYYILLHYIENGQ